MAEGEPSYDRAENFSDKEIIDNCIYQMNPEVIAEQDGLFNSVSHSLEMGLRVLREGAKEAIGAVQKKYQELPKGQDTSPLNVELMAVIQEYMELEKK